MLHPSLGATLHAVVHTENTPPLWYVLAWADARVLGTGEVALRLLSALAGIATVPVAWAIGRELAGRRAAAIAARRWSPSNPLFVWYSQEARAYALFVLLAAARDAVLPARPSASRRRARMAAFALSGSLALLSHYFAVFLLDRRWSLWLLLRDRARRRAALPRGRGARGRRRWRCCPLISAQGGHGTQWIGDWALSQPPRGDPAVLPDRLLRAPRSATAIELLVALPMLAGARLGLWRVLDARARSAARADRAGARRRAAC